VRGQLRNDNASSVDDDVSALLLLLLSSSLSVRNRAVCSCRRRRNCLAGVCAFYRTARAAEMTLSRVCTTADAARRSRAEQVVVDH